MKRWLLAIGFVAALAGGGLVAAWALGAFSPSVNERLASVRKGSGAPVYYLGRSFGGLPLTHVTEPSSTTPGDFGYGHCHFFGSRWNPLDTDRCGYPLYIQTRPIDQSLTLQEEDLPHQFDGSCARTTLRGVPAAVGEDGVTLYTSTVSVALLGEPGLVARAARALRPARSGIAPTLGPPAGGGVRSALANCSRARRPLEPVATRLAALRRSSGRPVLLAGDWFEGGHLTRVDTGAGATGVGYSSCGPSSDSGDCEDVLSLQEGAVDVGRVRSDLRGAKCTRTTVLGAPAVIWKTSSSSGTFNGFYLLTGTTMITIGGDAGLDSVDTARLKRAAKALRPVQRLRRLPPPAGRVGRLLDLCTTKS